MMGSGVDKTEGDNTSLFEELSEGNMRESLLSSAVQEGERSNSVTSWGSNVSF